MPTSAYHHANQARSIPLKMTNRRRHLRVHRTPSVYPSHVFVHQPITHHAVDPDAGNQQRQKTKHAKQEGAEASWENNEMSMLSASDITLNAGRFGSID
jgi:hypothetical protein